MDMHDIDCIWLTIIEADIGEALVATLALTIADKTDAETAELGIKFSAVISFCK